MGNTTIQIGQDCADRLKELSGGAPYDLAIRQLLSLREAKPGPYGLLSFAKTVAVITQDEEDRLIPFDGYLHTVFMNFPPGPNHLVDVRLLYIRGQNTRFVVPSRDDSFIALDDSSPIFPNLNFPVEKDGRLRVEWWNYDSSNTHKIPVVVIMSAVPVLR